MSHIPLIQYGEGRFVTDVPPEEFDDVTIRYCDQVHLQSMDDDELWIGVYGRDPLGGCVHVRVSIEDGKLSVRVESDDDS